MITENLSTLTIHKLTEDQYSKAYEEGRIDPSALYLTPDEELDLSGFATVEDLATKANITDVEKSLDDVLHTVNDFITTDTTLKLDGVAADAKATGTAIERVLEDIPTKISQLENDTNFGGLVKDCAYSGDNVVRLNNIGTDTLPVDTAIRGAGNTNTLYRYGKNLLPMFSGDSSGTFDGIDWVLNSDGSMTFHGSSINERWSSLYLCNGLKLPAGRYTFSGILGGSLNTYHIVINTYLPNKSLASYTVCDAPVSFIVDNDALVSVTFYVKKYQEDGYTPYDLPIEGITIYPQIEYEGDVTQSCYINDLEIAPAVTKTFDDVELTEFGAVEKLSNCISSKDVTINNATGKSDTCALYFNRSSDSKVSEMRYLVRRCNKLTAEFEIRTTDNSVFYFQLINGEPQDSSIISTIKLSAWSAHPLAVQTGTSSYTALSTTALLTKNAWNKIKLELDLTSKQLHITLNGTKYSASSLYRTLSYIDNIRIYSGGTSHTCQICNIKVSTETYDTFDEAELIENFPETLYGHAEHHAATVVDNPVQDANLPDKVLLLESEAGSGVYSHLHYTFGEATSAVLDFNIYPKSDEIIYLRFIKKNIEDAANTAFWIKFDNKTQQGVWSYDGTSNGYTRISNNCLTTNTWNSVHLEVSSGKNARLGVSINGSSLDFAEKPSMIGGSADIIDGVYINTDYRDTEEQIVGFYIDSLEVNASTTAKPSLGESLTTMPGYRHHRNVQSVTDTYGDNGQVLAFRGNLDISAYLDQYFANAKNLTLEFKAFLESNDCHLTTHLYAYEKNYADTAFWLDFSDSVLRAFDGTAWTVLDTGNVALTKGAWNDIRLELVNGENSLAKIFVNDNEVGSTNIVCNRQLAINGIAFETHGDCYIDGITVTPETWSETFADLEPYATLNSIPGFIPGNSAIIKSAPPHIEGVSNKAIYLADNGGISVPYFEMPFEYDQYSLEFKVFVPNANSSLVCHINAGNDEVFMVDFNAYYGLRAFVNDTKSWELGSGTKLIPNQWNTVVMTVVADDAERSLELFVNPTEDSSWIYRLGDAHICKRSFNANNGLYMFMSTPTQKCYIDDIVLRPYTSVADDLRSAGKFVVVSPEVFSDCVDSNAALIKNNIPGGRTGNALMLEGQEGLEEAPRLQYKFDFHSDYALDFDVYIPSKTNTIAFNIYDGDQEDNNTAYILAFNYLNGLQVFHGTHTDASTHRWEVLNPEAKLKAATWNNVRIEVNNSTTICAKVFLNNELVGTTNVRYFKKEPVNGFYVYVAEPNQSCYIDNLKFIIPHVKEDFNRARFGSQANQLLNCIESTSAVIRENPVDRSDKCLKLDGSIDCVLAPKVTYPFAECEELDLNFEVFCDNAETITNLFITSASTESCTLQFSSAGTSYYTTYSDNEFNCNCKLLLNQWNSVRCKIYSENVGSTIEVYVNDELAYEIPNSITASAGGRIEIFTGGATKYEQYAVPASFVLNTGVVTKVDSLPDTTTLICYDSGATIDVKYSVTSELLPTRVSQLVNDAEFVTQSYIDKVIEEMLLSKISITYSGTTTPSNSLGKDGDIYIQY